MVAEAAVVTFEAVVAAAVVAELAVVAAAELATAVVAVEAAVVAAAVVAAPVVTGFEAGVGVLSPQAASNEVKTRRRAKTERNLVTISYPPLRVTFTAFTG
jgi:hypothetical protein